MIRWLLGILSLCLFFLGARAHAVEMTGSARVVVTADSATVTWNTDVPCGTRLSLGTDLNKLQPKAEGEVTDHHSVTLTGLAPGTTYYYAVASAKQKLGAGTFVIPPAGGSTAVAPLPPPPSRPPVTPVPSSKSVVERLREALTPKSAAKTPPPQSATPTPSLQRPPAAEAPPSSRTWGNPASLPDHFARHGADFQSRNQDDYAAKAWLFLQRARTQPLPMKLDEDGTLRVWEAKTGTFAAYNHDGTTKTFFKPGNGTYWQRQPGRVVGPMELPSSLQQHR